jgi:hypothetical protein
MRGGLVSSDQKNDILTDNFFFGHFLARVGVLSLQHHIQQIFLALQCCGVIFPIFQTLARQ